MDEVLAAAERYSNRSNDNLAEQRSPAAAKPPTEQDPEVDPDMTAPAAVAGLADTVKNAIAGMARAKLAADQFNASAQRLVGNLANVDAVRQQLDTANQQLEQAMEAVGGPLESGESTQGGSPVPVTGAAGEAKEPGPTPAEGIRQSIAQVQAANQ
jgi:hypothetical protein